MRYLSKITLLGIMGASLMCLSLNQSGKAFAKGVIMISGKYLDVWNICYADFMKIEDLANEEKQLDHYDISFSEEGDFFVVELIPKLLPKEKAKMMNAMVVGRNIKYWVNKDNLKIAKRAFYKS